MIRDVFFCVFGRLKSLREYFVRSTFFVFCFLVEEEKRSERGERDFFLCVFLALIKTDLLVCAYYYTSVL